MKHRSDDVFSESLKGGMWSARCCGDGEYISKAHMAQFLPGHFSINPDDHEGREMITTVRSGHGGKELSVEFRATIRMEMSAFQMLVKKQFKGVYWLSEKPVVVEG